VPQLQLAELHVTPLVLVALAANTSVVTALFNSYLS